MTAAELLALLGRVWPRLLLWPGGLALALLLWARWRGWDQRGPPLALAGPWLALALLPLPGAAETPLALDALVTVALLELPLLCAQPPSIAEAMSPQRREDPKATKVGRPWGYGLLLAGFGLLTRPSGSMLLGRLMLPPPADTPLWASALHWCGAALLLSALPLLLRGTLRPANAALRIRALGWALIAALPLLGLLIP